MAVPVTLEEADPEHADALTDEQVAAIVAKAPERHRLLIRVAADTGLRRSELLALRWRDVGDGVLQVRRRLRAGKIAPPKSDAGRRDVPISAALARDLDLARATSMHPEDNGYIFGTATGQPLQEGNAHRRAMKPAAEAAGVPWAAFHDLRRAAITRWLVAGLPLKVVQVLAGHSDPSVTLKHYAKVRAGDVPAGEALAVG